MNEISILFGVKSIYTYLLFNCSSPKPNTSRYKGSQGRSHAKPQSQLKFPKRTLNRTPTFFIDSDILVVTFREHRLRLIGRLRSNKNEIIYCVGKE